MSAYAHSFLGETTLISERFRRHGSASEIANLWMETLLNPVSTVSDSMGSWISDWIIDARQYIKATESLSSQVLAIIGGHGAVRFEQFKCYPEGWDGDGKAVSFESVGVFNWFASEFLDMDYNGEASLFMTREGNLQLSWEDKQGSTIELEFYPHKIAYYIGSREIEGESMLADFHSIVSQYIQ